MWGEDVRVITHVTRKATGEEGNGREGDGREGDGGERNGSEGVRRGDDVVICFPGAKIEAITERVEKIMGPGKGGSILVYVGTNN